MTHPVALDPIIEAVAKAYEFDIEYVEPTGHWIIHGLLYGGVVFNWNTASSKTFFTLLREAFNEEGVQTSSLF